MMVSVNLNVRNQEDMAHRQDRKQQENSPKMTQMFELMKKFFFLNYCKYFHGLEQKYVIINEQMGESQQKNGNYKRRPNKNCKTDNEIFEMKNLNWMGLIPDWKSENVERMQKNRGKLREKNPAPKMYLA